MANQEELDKLLGSFSTGLKLDVTPPTVSECVIVRFEDGTMECIDAEELEKHGL